MCHRMATGAPSTNSQGHWPSVTKLLEKLSHTECSPITLPACQCNKASEKLSHSGCRPIALPVCQPFGETRLVTPSHTKHRPGGLCAILTRSLAKEVTRFTQKPSHLTATRAHLGFIVNILRRKLRSSPTPPQYGNSHGCQMLAVILLSHSVQG